MKYFIITLIFTLLAFGCEKLRKDRGKNQIDDTFIINSVICELLVKIDHEFEFLNRYLLYHNIYPDNAKTASIKNFLNILISARPP